MAAGGEEGPGRPGARRSRENSDGRTPGGEQERLFIGVPCPEGLLPLVEKAQAALDDLPGVRLTRREHLHVTLAFLGGVPFETKREALAVVRAAGSEAPGEAVLGDILPLPSVRRARVVALEIDDREGAFQRLFERVMGGLEDAGVMRREKRPFRPHLTIARLRQPAIVQPKYEGEPAVYPVRSVCLYRSELRPEGARYTIIEQAELGGGEAG